MKEVSAGPESVLRLERTLSAPRERVFRAWTDADQLRKWFGGPVGFTTPRAEIDLRIGGTYRVEIRSPEGNSVFATGRYLEIEPPSRLVFTFGWRDFPGIDIGETTVTVQLFDREGSTELVLTHEPFAAAQLKSFHEFGWTTSLERLAEGVSSEGALGVEAL